MRAEPSRGGAPAQAAPEDTRPPGARHPGFRAHLRAAATAPGARPPRGPRPGAQGAPAPGDLVASEDQPARRRLAATSPVAPPVPTAGAPPPVGQAQVAPAPLDAAAHAEAARAAVAWIARCAVAAAAAPGVLRLHLDDRRLGRVGVQVRVRSGRVLVEVAAKPATRRALLAETGALAGDLARRGLALEALRCG